MRFMVMLGPTSKIGEGSIRLAEALKLEDVNPKTGGTESKVVVFLVFPGSVEPGNRHRFGLMWRIL